MSNTITAQEIKLVGTKNIKVYEYTLKNGLKILMSPNHSEPKIFIGVRVNAGSKDDPKDKTGLAHYLEHLLFKGTSKIGTINYQEEKKYLQQIEELYEKYNQTEDEKERLKIYKQIDSVSQIAAKYAIPNEYDRLMAFCGSQTVNAFTSYDNTGYINYIPSNQLERWCKIEAERFKNPEIRRLFHTELETVFEEKNISLDKDGSYAFETLMKNLFLNHPYKNTILGSVEHLKNPSIKRIKEFLKTYYVPNNLTIILAGDLNPEATAKTIEKYFGDWEVNSTVKRENFHEPLLRETKEIDIYGKDPEFLYIAFKIDGNNPENLIMSQLIDHILYNEKAGLIDINLKKKQKLLSAYAYTMDLKDYYVLMLYAKPKKGQSLKELQKLLLQQIDSIKQGNFDENLIKTVAKNEKVNILRDLQTNPNRFDYLLTALTHYKSWDQFMSYMENIEKISQEQITNFANKYLNNYVIVRKNLGERKAVKIPKPPITPLEINRDTLSDFAKKVLNEKVKPLKPEFVNFNKEIQTIKIANKIPLYYHKNTENDLFKLTIKINIGKHHNNKLPFATEYYSFLGTDKFSAEEISQKFYEIACNFKISTTQRQVIITLSGLQNHFEEAVELAEHYITSLKPDEQKLREYISLILKNRENRLKNKDVISQATKLYALYGETSDFKQTLSNQQLMELNATELTGLVKNLFNYEHYIMYYGKESIETVAKILEKKHSIPEEFLIAPELHKPEPVYYDKPIILFYNYPEMVQSRIMWLANGKPFDVETFANSVVFNYYFGLDMYSLAFQEIREAKGLAYSTYGLLRKPTYKDEHFYFNAYVGTQADKTVEAITSMNNLIYNLPKIPQQLETAKTSVINQVLSTRYVRDKVLTFFDSMRALGLDYDVSKDLYYTAQNYSLPELDKFYNKIIKPLTPVLVIIGDKTRINQKELQEKFKMKIREISKDMIFGY